MRPQHLGNFAGTFEHEIEALLDRQAGQEIELEREFPILARIRRPYLEDSRGISQSL